jgi:hypothetical protein
MFLQLHFICFSCVATFAVLCLYFICLTNPIGVAACSGGKEGAADADTVLPTLEFISTVFQDVDATITMWCKPSRMGAAITVLRNMAIASWYQVRHWKWVVFTVTISHVQTRQLIAKAWNILNEYPACNVGHEVTCIPQNFKVPVQWIVVLSNSMCALMCCCCVDVFDRS